MTNDEINKLRKSYICLDTYEKEAGKRNFTTAELKEVIASQKYINKSIPKLLGMIERLQDQLRNEAHE